MGRPGCSSCCKVTDPPKRSDCVVDDFKFYYTLYDGRELETVAYVDELVKNQRKGPHEELQRVRQFINKRDAGEYRTLITAFSWSKDDENYGEDFDVTSHDRPPKDKFNYEFLSENRSSGYFVPRTFNIFLGASPRKSNGDWPQDRKMSISRKLKISKVSVMSAGEDYGIRDYQFTDEGVTEAGGDKNAFPDFFVEKGCSNEKTMQVQYGVEVGQVFGEAAMDAARNGSIFQSGFPRDRTNIQIERTTYVLGYEQTVEAPSIDGLASGPKTFFHGFPIYMQFKAYNFGEQLFVRGRSCGFVGTELCAEGGGTVDIDTATVLAGYGEEIGKSPEKIIEEFLNDYRSVDYCLTYPFLKMDDGTYWFKGGSKEKRESSGQPSVCYEYGQAEPAYMGTGGPTRKACGKQIDLQGTHHSTPEAMKSIRVDSEDFVWFNPFVYETKFDKSSELDFGDTNEGIGVNIQPTQWQKRFPDSEALTPVAEPAEGEPTGAFDAYKKSMLDLLQDKEQTEYVPGAYFEFVDNKLKGNEYDIPQIQYLHVKRADLLYNVYDMILTGEKAFNFLTDKEAYANQNNEANDVMWTKWHENIIVVQVRSEQSAEDWLKRTGVAGAKVRVDDEVYHPVGSCTETTIKTINYNALELNKIDTVELESGQTVFLNDIELKKDTITYGIDGRVYRMIMWLESKLVGNDFESDWQEVVEDGQVKELKYKPLSYKVKNIYIENYRRPYPVGPEISSFDEYPTNDTKINLITKTSFEEMADPRKKKDVEPHVLSMYNTVGSTCKVPVKPDQWLADFAAFDNNIKSLDAPEAKDVVVPFYYLNEDDEPVGRLLSDDDVITIGTKLKTQYIKNKLRCQDIKGGQHWDLDTWMYYQPERNGTRHFEPELTKNLPDCRKNPYAATYKHTFPKEGEQTRRAYINNEDLDDNTWNKSVDFSFTQTPDAGYLFTTEAGNYYKITFEFEPILDWRSRTLQQLRRDN